MPLCHCNMSLYYSRNWFLAYWYVYTMMQGCPKFLQFEPHFTNEKFWGCKRAIFGFNWLKLGLPYLKKQNHHCELEFFSDNGHKTSCKLQKLLT